MKRIIVACQASVLLITACTAFADATAPTELDQKIAKREAAFQKMYKATGGMVDRPHAKGGKFVFVNAQKIVPSSDLQEPVAVLTRILRHDVAFEECESGAPFSIATAQEQIARHDAKGAVFLVEDAALPTLLVAPESGWGTINVSRLAEDNPDKLLLAQRVRREMWRCFAMVNGGSNTRMGNCVLQTVLSLKDLDGLQAEAFCPEPMNQILEHLDALGVKKYQRTTYKQACIEGWAPAPTNEVQQVIWEKVKAEQSEQPSNPLKITPGMKPKGK